MPDHYLVKDGDSFRFITKDAERTVAGEEFVGVRSAAVYLTEHLGQSSSPSYKVPVPLLTDEHGRTQTFFSLCPEEQRQFEAELERLKA
ncbi:MAG: hypothetical protein KJ600_03945 [Nanoarchaeota archaeon]|nr:hypothetical protein [Nanoarchaeota archaeon]MBU1103680.1 hypothetical protein [Nanoarchaeota archaeon]